MSTFFSQHHLLVLVHTCQEVDKTEDQGKIKAKRNNVNVGRSIAVLVMLSSSKAHLRGHPGLIHSAPLAFMSTENVSMVRAAYRVQIKPNVVF